MTSSGLPDMHIVINCISLEVEIKAPKGKASELQKHIVEQIVKSDCNAAILYEHQKDIPDDGFQYYINYEQFKDAVLYHAKVGDEYAVQPFKN